MAMVVFCSPTSTSRATGTARFLPTRLVYAFLVLLLLIGSATSDFDHLTCSDEEDNDGLTDTPGAPVCSSQDRKALLQFKSAISSDPNHVLVDWHVSNANCCSWTGVTCDGATGRVVRLKLYNQNLKGRLSPGISDLSSLQVLILDDNDFFGTIPSSLGTLESLRRLCLSNLPSLKGPIPESFGRLKNLELLDLSSDALSGPLPSSFGGMSNLQALYLYGNNISGTIPASFGLLSRLYLAGLSSNQIEGRVPDSFTFGLTSLVFLDLSNNKITGLPKDLRSLGSLEYIRMSNNPLMSGDSVEGIATAPQISEIHLSSCMIKGPFPAWVSRLPQPDTEYISEWVTPSLDLSNNAISGEIPPALGNLTNLQRLSLENNKLRGSIPTSFVQLQSLQLFNVSYNNLSGKIPQASPFTTFDTSAYIPGNRGLCGHPLGPCKS
ncbi:hypothetical protein KP509_11G001000 [Ceratopteris richardii]|uniref:Leucine-rich repeat-containing N-terminal plant-type domain-containing protein n=1 Tax=Ceratopteris richardii TaxID=49495 RepID=A0A8T2TRA2_CERRI|nr:hypothetical protein KP509_11G001000 [Ceratopteris richardii]